MRTMPDMSSVSELEKNTYDKKTRTFTGDIIYYTWEGRPLVRARYENGKRIEWNYVEQKFKKNETDGARTNSGCYSTEIEWYSIACSAYGCGEPIYLYSNYYNFCSGGSSPYTDEYADPGNLYGGGGGGGGDYYYPEPIYTISVDPSLSNHQKANCIYEKLTQNSVFNSLINGFENNQNLNLNFKLADLTGSLNGLTQGYYPFNNISITIDKPNLEVHRTVEVSRTFIHEAIHAQIFAEMGKAGLVDASQATSENFPALFDAYVDYKNGDIPEDQIQHQLMANKYLDIISAGLHEFDTRNNNNPEIIIDHYKALAWEGLRGTKAWNNLSDSAKSKIISDKAEILDWHSVINCN